MTSGITRLFAILLLLISAGWAQTAQSPAATPATPQTTKPEIKHVPAIYTDASSGRQMYDAYCASCHGQGGKGNGPAAPALKTQPTDLTQLAAKNGGDYPWAHVTQAIKGDLMTPSHGSKEMPVWGPVFLYLGNQNASLEQLRIRNLTKYIGGMQQKSIAHK